MWKKIINSEIIDEICAGRIITNNLHDPIDQYEVKVIHTGSHFVKVVHANGRIVLKLFPEKDLIFENW